MCPGWDLSERNSPKTHRVSGGERCGQRLAGVGAGGGAGGRAGAGANQLVGYVSVLRRLVSVAIPPADPRRARCNPPPPAARAWHWGQVLRSNKQMAAHKYTIHAQAFAHTLGYIEAPRKKDRNNVITLYYVAILRTFECPDPFITEFMLDACFNYPRPLLYYVCRCF